MKVGINLDKCIGSGMCTTIAPSVFELEHNGKVVVLKQKLTSAELEAVKDAIACCPVDAITLRGSENE